MMVIAGTKDAREAAQLLLKRNWPVVATVTTAYGRELLGTLPDVEVLEGKLTKEDMQDLLLERDIPMVLDASHPFAQEVSRNAMDACREAGACYLRFEREEAPLPEGGAITVVHSFQEAAEAALRYEGNLFLAIGSNHLAVFTDRLGEDRHRVYARVLPDSRMVRRCEEAGLSPGNIVAVKGPFSEALNLEMLRHCQAKVLVTKESGETGGTREKLLAARQLGIPVILVKRPPMDYPRQVSTLKELAAFLDAMA